jgi:O-methyltransferase involved in polyketide biosynthesis
VDVADWAPADWAPADVDLTRPNAARVYDYYLGGSHNFAIDRQMAQQAIELWPDVPMIVRANRAFLRRAVRQLIRAGVRQFLDLGSGIPTRGNVHEKAQRLNPDAKVVYVDHDPVAIAHGQAILRGNDRVKAILGDVRDPGAIIAHPAVRDLIDFDRPVGLLLVSVLHFVFDEYDPKRIVATLRDALPPGSYVAIQHATADKQPETTLKMLEYFNSQSPEPMRWRTREEITALLGGFTILEPGVVFLSQWRPGSSEVEPNPERFASYTAIGRKD